MLTHSKNLKGNETVSSRIVRPSADGRAPSASFSSWQTAREKIVIRACVSLDGHVSRGRGLLKSARIVARRYHGRNLKADGSRKIHLSAKTLMRLHHHWVENGRASESLALRYQPARTSLTSARLDLFIQAALVPGTCGYQAAYVRCQDAIVTVSAYIKALPPGIKRALGQLFYRERLARFARRKVLRALPRNWKERTA